MRRSSEDSLLLFGVMVLLTMLQLFPILLLGSLLWSGFDIAGLEIISSPKETKERKIES